MDFQRSLSTWGATAFKTSVQNPWSDWCWGQGNPKELEAAVDHASQCTHTRINSQENLKIHPKPGETHMAPERWHKGQAHTDVHSAGPALRLRVGSWPSAHTAGRPECRRTPSARATGAPQAVPAGPRSSHSRFLGDCCQVRNSKAEFIILADKRRCSSPEL